MEEILKQDKSKSHQEFEKLLSEDLGNRKFKEGELATGVVEEIGKKFVFIGVWKTIYYLVKPKSKL